MKLNDIIFGSSSVLFILLTLVEITPIKINPISWICTWIGKQTQKETLKKIDTIQKDITSVKEDIQKLKDSDLQNEATDCRYRILRFADECYLGQNHSMEHFKQILQDITIYESYCDAHPDFPNNVAIMAISQIKSNYQNHVNNHDFLS